MILTFFMQRRSAQKVTKPQSIPRLVRMPPALDEWLKQQAEATNGRDTVADKIRECVARVMEAREQQAA
jgi:hypothetical protein